MRVRVLAVGKARRTPLTAATTEYLERCARFGGVELVRIRDEPDAGARPAAAREAEGRRLLLALAPGARVVVLDERGAAWTSERLSGWLSDGALHGVSRVDFVVGGPYGLSEAVRRRADEIVRLSSMTLPHEMALLVLAEQIYRAFTLWRGEPYHNP